LTVKTLSEGVIPATRNYAEPDPEIDLDVVAGSPRRGDYRYAISTSFGFGGYNVALVFGAP
ncbi:beta-ketoacyl-ACP synthase, partial [Mycolicibacterium pulveris]